MNQLNSIMFGAAYYDEYSRTDRLARDIRLMKAAHVNTVRIAESTWSTLEPEPGEFNFSHVDRVVDAMERAGINVIVGTPTYAVPTWLVARHPEILVCQHGGRRGYGPRQIMDIANKDFRYYAERVIRTLIGHVAQRKSVIGYQIDNETKYYDVLNRDVQQAFVESLRMRFDGDLKLLNKTFGLDYWSNRVDDWDSFPDLADTINGSLAGAFDRFRRSLVAEYLSWQASIIREYARGDQFITHNHDLEWRGYSYGVQPWADHFENAKVFDYTGVDIYHPTESKLTGKDIAFGGDLTRSTKNGKNYLVLETEAQGQNGWLPYPGQLRLQAYSHLASGSNSVMYWHWNTLNNAFETYWKGVLSQDGEPNPVYDEASVFGSEIEQIGSHLVNLRKTNHVAIIVSNDSLSALNRFTIETGFPKPNPYEEGESSGLKAYNDVVRWLYDALFELNVEADVLFGDHADEISAERLDGYDLILTPALYCVSESLIRKLRDYVQRGGHLLSTFKSFFANEDVTVWDDRQPHGLTDVFGMHYGEFTNPDSVRVIGDSNGPLYDVEDDATTFMELIRPDEDTQVLAAYGHQAWNRYSAITRHRFGEGWAQWIATMFSAQTLRSVVRDAVRASGITSSSEQLADAVTIRQGVNGMGKHITYLLNYSSEAKTLSSPYEGEDLLRSCTEHKPIFIKAGDKLAIAPWDLKIIES